MTEIGERAFADCTSLASVDIPEGVKRIGDEAFSGCKSLKKVVFYGTRLGWKNLVLNVCRYGSEAFLEADIECTEE